MAEIITSIQPGRYTTGQTLTVKFPPNSRKAIVTRDDKAPVLSEILAYDTGPILPVPSLPPGQSNPNPVVERPFLAVTQDGKGNVIYDGGFPKFLNSQIRTNNGGTWPATLPNTWAQLSPASKYLYNGINFCANQSKVIQGNRKVLFICNARQGESYVMTDSHYFPRPGQPDPDGLRGFSDTFRAICAAGNWTPTFVDCPATGQIDFTFTELDAYVAVVFVASADLANVAATRVTDNFCKEMAAYRAAGNGIAIITDHCGANYTSLADAVANSSIYCVDATRLAKEYGCYFSGDVNRSPVSVGEIKRQIGLPGPPESHPLLNGLADTDIIYAGGSESLVIPELYTANIVDPAQDLVVVMNTDGNYRVNVLVQMEDGSILTRPMLFTIVNAGDFAIKDSFARIPTDSSITYRPAIDYTIHNLVTPTATMAGEIYLNDFLQGYFSVINKITMYKLFAGPNSSVPAKNGDIVKFIIKDPVEYGMSLKLNIAAPGPYYEASGTIADFIGKIKTHPYFNGITDIETIMADMQQFADTKYALAAQIGPSVSKYYWKTIGKGRLPFRNSEPVSATLGVYTDPADWTTNKPAFGSTGQASIVASNNEVYYWDNLTKVWIKHPQGASDLFGLGRYVLDTRTSTRWIIQLFTTVKV